MLEIAVIADDLTGAADTGVQFCRLARPNYLLAASALATAQFPDSPKAVTVHTSSRHLPPLAARNAVTQAARALKSFQPSLIYKKIDSCLRGNLGPEIDALLEELGLEQAFVAPAFPAQGRLTIHDEHLIHGIPLGKTEIAKDPINPVKCSLVSEVIAAQTCHDVGVVDIEATAKGSKELEQAVSSLLKKGKKIIVFDACEQEHLENIARLSLDRYPGSLLVGSAGLALGLAEVVTQRQGKKQATSPSTQGSLLFVGGSASARLADQHEALVAQNQASQMILDAEMLADPKAREQRRKWGDEAAVSLAQTNLVLRITPPEENKSKPSSEAVAQGLAQVAAAAALTSSPAGMFLSGGDTAQAVFEQLEVQAVELHAEVLPGLVWGTIMGGPQNGGLVVTKAGAFGEDDDLVKLHGLLCGQA